MRNVVKISEKNGSQLQKLARKRVNLQNLVRKMVKITNISENVN